MIVGAVIITFNSKLDDLNKLINSIISSVKQIVVVDNGSSNIEEIILLLNTFPRLHLMPLGQNTGIGYAQNRGIELVFDDPEIDSVIMFDHDSHPSDDMVDALKSDYQKLWQKGLKVAAVGPVFIDPRTQNKYPITLFKGFRLKKIFPVKGDKSPILTSFLIASGCLIPRSTIETTGLMNEGFFIDYIDIEWSFRVQSMGYSLFACPNATMYHQVGDERMKVLGREISIHSPLRRYYLARNSILMVRTSYINWHYKVREIVYTFTRVIIYLALVDKKMNYLKYITRGWYDGLLGRTGRCQIIQKDQ